MHSSGNKYKLLALCGAVLALSFVSAAQYLSSTGKTSGANQQSTATISYTYDAAGRLTLVDYGNGTSIQYTYDAMGNLISQTVTTPAPVWQPVVLTASQVDLKSWTFQGRTYVYVKLLFPNAGYRVVNWGTTTKVGNDFTVDAAVEKFTGPSVLALTTTAQIYDLGPLADGAYNFNFKTSGTLAKTLQFSVSSTVPPPNPIDDARQFVKQQYRDFLNREADQAGEDFWTDNITKCADPARRPAGQTEAQCTLRQRETTSGAFFLSPEFQYTGYYVYRVYQGALGRQPKLSEFLPDAQFVGNGIVVNGQLSGAKINQNKADFAAQFVNCTDAATYRCAEFKAIYDPLTNAQFVDKLFETTGVTVSAADKTSLVNGLNGATETRATVLQKVVDGINVISEGNQQFTTTYGQAFYDQQFNRAFVQLEYFGYMKRDPDEAGYNFWLGKLNQFGGNFVNAEMVLAFISSPEYRARFGQP
jgi:YD repeat-containing protein